MGVEPIPPRSQRDVQNRYTTATIDLLVIEESSEQSKDSAYYDEEADDIQQISPCVKF